MNQDSGRLGTIHEYDDETESPDTSRNRIVPKSHVTVTTSPGLPYSISASTPNIADPDVVRKSSMNLLSISVPNLNKADLVKRLSPTLNALSASLQSNLNISSPPILEVSKSQEFDSVVPSPPLKGSLVSLQGSRHEFVIGKKSLRELSSRSPEEKYASSSTVKTGSVLITEPGAALGSLHQIVEIEEKPSAANEEVIEVASGTVYKRNQLVERYHALVAERKKILKKRKTVELKILEFFRRKPFEEYGKTRDSPTPDQQEEYQRLLDEFEYERKEEKKEEVYFQFDTDRLANECDTSGLLRSQAVEEYLKLKQQTADNAKTYALNAEQIHEQITGTIVRERKKEEQLTSIRLDGILLDKKVAKQLRRLEETGKKYQGTSVRDFEKWRVETLENLAYSEKLEERKEEIIKIEKKTTEAVHKLAHIQAKIHHLVHENAELWHDRVAVEEELMTAREVTAQARKKCERARRQVRKSAEENQLYGKKDLLLDMQNTKETNRKLQDSVANLREEFKNLSKQLKEIKKGVKK